MRILRAVMAWIGDIIERIGVECAYREFATFEEAARYQQGLIDRARRERMT